MRERLEKRMQEMPTQPREMARKPADADLQARIAEAAYYRAERRGFVPGSEIEDWLAAEDELGTRQRP
jgi:hypothetical protein